MSLCIKTKKIFTFLKFSSDFYQQFFTASKMGIDDCKVILLGLQSIKQIIHYRSFIKIT